MAGKGIIMATQEELRRLHVIEKVLEGGLKQVEAAEILSLSSRHIRRVVKRVKKEGSPIERSAIEPQDSGSAQG
jgi:transposase